MANSGLDNAAARALWGLRDKPAEHIGLLYHDGGAVQATPAQTRGDASRAGGTFAIPAGSLRAVYHNHPPRALKRGAIGESRRDANRARFSVDDIEQARRLGIPSYIAAGNEMLRFDPETGSTSSVLAEIPVDAVRRKIMVEILGRVPDDPRGAYR